MRDLGINEELVNINQQAGYEQHRQTAAMQTPLDNIDALLQSNQDDLLGYPQTKSQLDNYQPYSSDFEQATAMECNQTNSRHANNMREKLRGFKNKLLNIPFLYQEHLANVKKRRQK